MKASALKNLNVISLADGAKLGNVDGVLFDSMPLQIAALGFSGSAGRKVLIPFPAIRSIGNDAVVIETVQNTQASNAGDLGQARELGHFTGLKVMDDTGTLRGKVSDFEVEPTKGQVTDIYVQSGGVLGLGAHQEVIPASAIRGIGPEMITIEAGQIPSSNQL